MTASMSGAPVGKIRSPWTVILLTIVTCGLYSYYWFYAIFNEMKVYSGQGIGGVVSLIFVLICAIINLFVGPSEIAALYEADGRQSPVSTMTGFWFLLPILGGFVWLFKMQNALNGYWESKGAVAA